MPARFSFQFPSSFVFGAATAAFQIEGYAQADGKGPSIWDEFSHQKGKIRKGHNANTACEHYKRYTEDIALLKALHLDAYRFSVSWPRVFPDGEKTINQAGLDYYSRLTDRLLEKGITPYATLFHWDLPLALQKKYSGFAARKTAWLFADYAETVVKHLGDRVKNWITVNEPWEFSGLGHLLGVHAPGKKNPWTFFRVMHNLLLAHGLAAQRIKSLFSDARVGITLSLTPVHAHSQKPKDMWAAQMGNQFLNHITLAPLYKKQYPELLRKHLSLFMPKTHAQDFDIIAYPTDFLGINNYQREFAMYKWYIPFFQTWISGLAIPDHDFVKDGVQHTSMGWEVYPPSIYESLKIIKDKYNNPPVYVTENGAAFDDVVEDGKVFDTKRADYLDTYLKQVERAHQEGCDVRGYFVWSLLDNFEWAAGLDKRFGLVYVDYDSQKRIIKTSGLQLARALAQRSNREKS